MKFVPAAPNENFIRRWVSTEGGWEIGHTQMLFGVRVRLGRVGYGCVALDLCAGPSRDRQDELLRLVMLIVLPMPESIDEGELERAFPRFTIKPIFNDPNWPKLQELADAVLKKDMP